MDVFPGVKIILTLRDPEDWYESISKTIFSALEIEGKIRSILDSSHKILANQLTLYRVFSGRHKNKESILQIYNEHVRNVEEWVPAESLLKFRVAEGWQLLCDFLGVPVPDQPFPRSNEMQNFRSPLSLRI